MLNALLSETLLNQLCEYQPEAIAWFIPVYDEVLDQNQIIDFEVQYCNSACCKKSGLSKEETIGKRIIRDGFPDPTIAELKFEQCRQVLQTGQPIQYSYFSTYYQRYFMLSRVLVQDGILVTSRDLTDLYNAEQDSKKLLLEKQQQVKDFSDTLATCSNGVITMQSVRDDNGEIVDFVITQCNNAGFSLARLPKDAVGQNLLKVLPLYKTNGYFDIHKKVAETGEPYSAEFPFNSNNTSEGWFILSVSRLNDGIVSNLIDVTHIKSLEQQAMQRALEVDSIFQNSLQAIYLGEAIRNNEGEVEDLKFLRVNQKLLSMFGMSAEYLLQNTLLTVSPQTRKTNFITTLANVLRSGTPKQETLFYPHSNQWYEFSMVRVDADRVSVTFHNVTPLKQSTAMLDSIMLHSAAGISYGEVIRNEQGQIVDGRPILANDAAFRLTGIPRDLFFSKTSVELEPNILNTPYFQKIVHTMETGEPSLARYQVETSGKWIEVTLSRMDHDHLIIVFNDITESMEAQQLQQRLVEELSYSNKVLKEFTHSASHDLKEPIRKVRIFTTRLKEKLDGNLKTDEADLLERIQKSVDRMGLLVDDLLEYAQLSHPEDANEHVNLNLKLELVQHDLELLISEKQAIIKVGELPVINANRRQIQQLFQNLLTNSLRYSKPNETPFITINASNVQGFNSGFDVKEEDQQRHFYCIEVRDNGIGFEQEYAEQIFNVFTRLHGRSEYPGTGVGLAIVRKVVENHKGYIKANSTPGQGATFTFLLPA